MAELTAALLCRTCGAPATHAHFIPWIEEPDRVELACAIHEPGGDDGEWYTLLELEQGAAGFLRILDRSVAPAPEELRRWLEAQSVEPPQQRPGSTPPPPERGWLDVAEVADQVALSPKTIRDKARRRELEGTKVGSRWRFAQDAVDAWVASGRLPTGRGENPPDSRASSPRPQPRGRRFREMVGE